MTSSRILRVFVTASAVLVGACASNGLVEPSVGDVATAPASTPDERSLEGVPASRPTEDRRWAGRTDTDHAWIAVELTVDEGAREVRGFRFDSGCLGQAKSLVGWAPQDQVSGISERGQFSFASEGIIVTGTFHGDAFVEGAVRDENGFGFICDGVSERPIPASWRISAAPLAPPGS